MSVRYFVGDLETTDTQAAQALDSESDWRSENTYDLENTNALYGAFGQLVPGWDESLDTRVFMGGIQDFEIGVGLGAYSWYNDLDGTFEEMSSGGDAIGFYHNLRYDGAYILAHLLRLGYTVFQRTEDKRKPARGEFSILKNDMNVVYSLTWRHYNGALVELRDSLKLLGGQGVEALGKSLGMTQKLVGTFDYNLVRSPGYVPTPEEEQYLKNDVVVVAEAMLGVIAREPSFATSLTIGSIAKNWFVTHSLGGGDRRLGTRVYRQLFPELDDELDREIRAGYVGGYCYVNSEFQGAYNRQAIRLRRGVGRRYDVNSLYPSVMKGHRYPVGHPELVDPATWVDSPEMVGYVKIAISGSVKKDHFPTLQAKGTFRFGDTEYIRDTGEASVTVTLPLPLYRLMKEQYDINYEVVLKVWLFESDDTIFDSYVDHWYGVKDQAKRDGDKVLYMIAKLMLNNLYGKLSQSGLRGVAVPYLDEDGVVRDEITMEQGTPEYIPAGAYVTAHARVKLITAAQKIFRDVAYMDTDSIHATAAIEEHIDGNVLGAWDLEAEWTVARFIRQKCYLEIENVVDRETGEVTKKLDIKAGGATAAVKHNLTLHSNTWDEDAQDWAGRWDTDERRWTGIGSGEPREHDDVVERFGPGVAEIGKLMQKTVRGGVRLVNTTWRIAVPFGVEVDPRTGIEPCEWMEVDGIIEA